MHDPEFEKHVQKKLEELQFDPSGEVWTKVEQEIKKEKRRRPLLWIFLLSGLLLGAGYWALVAGNRNSEKTNDEVKNKKEKVKSEADDSTFNNKSVAENNTTIKPKTSSPQKKSLDDKQSVLLFQSKNEKLKSKKEKVKSEADDAIIGNNISSEKKNEKENVAADSQIEKVKSEKEKVKSKTDDAVVGNNNISSEKKNDVTTNDTKKENENIAGDAQINKEPVADKMKTSKTELSGKENIAADSQIRKTSVVKNVNSKKSKSLLLGFTGGTGISDIETFSSINYPASLNSTGGNVPGYNGSSSSIQSGISFYAGAFLEKSFSKKISLSAGLNYHYYSTRIRTGTKVDSVIYVAASAFNLNSTAQAGAYRGGTINNYNQHYHFIELPLLLDLRINSSNKIPVTWKGGFSFSYLINTNALQFDPSSGVYYKNNSLFNKTQVNAITGLMIGFYQRKNLIQIGPEIQYGVTKILNGNITNNQHMLYYGIGVSIIPQKK
ncbi:MAG TPA: outer membrane beta-barrel protein [Puia sp.]|nr:outer membrane beta-barrel protein [Puia sp.]